MYRGPKPVYERILSGGVREDRALAYLMLACLFLFVAQLPKLSRDAHLMDQDLNALMGGALMGVIFIAPLLFYSLAFIVFLGLKAMRRHVSAWEMRIVLFWALLASAPLVLLNGLVAGFIGPGLEQQLVGALWFGVFMWFWVAGIWRALRETEHD